MTHTLERQGSEFAELSREIKNAGLLRRRRGYYILRMTLNLAVFAGAWVVFVMLGNSWWNLVTAVVLAVMYTQFAFIGHDAGHKQIFSGRRANETIGYIHGGLIGISYDWWVSKHNRHHANPNHEDEDPDIDISVLAFTENQGMQKHGFVRWITRNQAKLFFPLLFLEGMSLHQASVWHVWQAKRRWLEIGLLTVHAILYVTAVFWVLSPGLALAFIAVHQGVWGFYMGCSFAPNHKGMPILQAGHQLDFLRKQVLTSRNVKGNWLTDWSLGGLNYQIEHHLFPNMARPHLKHAQVIVKNFCTSRNIDYAECGLFRSYGYVLEYLHEVSAPLRGPKQPAGQAGPAY